MPMSLEEFNREVLTDPISYDVWDTKYRLYHKPGETAEQSVDDTRRRVLKAVFAKDDNEVAFQECLRLVLRGILIPAGRVNAGAGAGRAVTEINCFVLPTVMDSMPGIQRVIAQGALTMQQGGGIGVDFSTIRPAGAAVVRTGSLASGMVNFADQMDSMCSSIASAGWRRGAMMLTLRDDHPDLWNPKQYETATNYIGQTILSHPSFISVKRQPGRLTQFNVSVLVSSKFLDAVKHNENWDLGFHVPRADGRHVDVYDKPFPYDYVDLDNDFALRESGREKWPRKGQMLPWFVYLRVPARRIWEDLMQATYKYSEPGVIFIDRVNERNNLYYCEEIRTTNPCGEQPLPPSGCCCLGSVNTAFLVKDPFTPNAKFDFATFWRAVYSGVRMLDNVLTVANFPLREQRQESDKKRRIGLGITGWGDALAQLGIRYGSKESIDMSRKVAKALREASYRASVELAKERGPFEFFDSAYFCEGYNVKQLPQDIRDDIFKFGIRNGVLNTIAPNGTISLYTGNVSSGHEPIFSLRKTMRKVRQGGSGEFKEYPVVDYAYRLYEHLYGETPLDRLPDYFVGAKDITPQEHVNVHCAWQEFIDASCSKTINVPTDISFDDFRTVYTEAYTRGAKGCTTYREDPESGRGSVLSDTTPATSKPAVAPARIVVQTRAEVLEGRTYKVKWPLTGDNWYITINNNNGIPCEVFIVTKNVQHQEWVTALTRTITAILRRGGDAPFLIDELTQVHSASGGAWMNKKYVPSVVAAIGWALETEFARLGITSSPKDLNSEEVSVEAMPQTSLRCPECNAPAWVKDAGCWHCLSCGHNTCG